VYEYRASVVRVHDADTLHVLADLGCHVSIHLTIRLAGASGSWLTQSRREARADGRQRKKPQVMQGHAGFSETLPYAHAWRVSENPA
jgi:hypothetical protein